MNYQDAHIAQLQGDIAQLQNEVVRLNSIITVLRRAQAAGANDVDPVIPPPPPRATGLLDELRAAASPLEMADADDSIRILRIAISDTRARGEIVNGILLDRAVLDIIGPERLQAVADELHVSIADAASGNVHARPTHPQN